MPGIKISERTNKRQRRSIEELREYRRRIYKYIGENSTVMLNKTDIARNVIDDNQDLDEIGRVAYYVAQMQKQGLISMYGGKNKGYWSQVTRTDKIAPTYKPPVPEEEPEEAQAEETEIEKPQKVTAMDSPTVKVPVKTGPTFHDVMPVRRITQPQELQQPQPQMVQTQPINLGSKPASITITINF